MIRQIVPKTAFLVFMLASLDGTFHLTRTYFEAVWGHPSAQWEFAFLMAPIPIALAFVAILISSLAKPKLTRSFRYASLIATLLPLLITTLVMMHLY